MPIKYALFENNITSDPADFAAIVQVDGSLDLDSLVDRMIAQGSTTTRADIMAVLEDSVLACEGALQDGLRINYGGLVELFPRIKGVFRGAVDAFDSARHTVDVGANAGIRVRNTVRANAKTQKVEAIKPAPSPIEYVDIGSATTNDQITPANIGQLTGSRLKFDTLQADEGAYFVATAGGETKVATVQRNKPSQLVFLIPAGLLAGTYNIEVRARIAGGTELRIGRLDTVLTV